MKEATKLPLEKFVLVTRAHTSGGAQPGLQGWAEFADWADREKNIINIFKKCIFALSHNEDHGHPTVIPVQQSIHLLKQKILN